MRKRNLGHYVSILKNITRYASDPRQC